MPAQFRRKKIDEIAVQSILPPAPPLQPKQGSRIPQPPASMEPLPPIRAEQPQPRSAHSTTSKQRLTSSSQVAELLNATLNDAPPFFRTFDKKEGRVVLHSSAEIPNQEKRAAAIFVALKKDSYEVEQAELRVTTLSEIEQVRLAAMALRRRAQRDLKRTIRKGQLDAATALVKTQTEVFPWLTARDLPERCKIRGVTPSGTWALTHKSCRSSVYITPPRMRFSTRRRSTWPSLKWIGSKPSWLGTR